MLPKSPSSDFVQSRWDPERFAGLFSIFGMVLTFGGIMIGSWQGFAIGITGLTLLLIGCYSRSDGLIILGPFVGYELRRIARKQRPQLWRSLYALAIGAMLLGNLYTYMDHTLTGSDLVKRMQYINEQFFNWFGICVFLYVCILTINQFTSIVTEERAQKRWDILLTTDLRSREILFGKVVGRLPQIIDPIIASIPVLALSTLFGGVQPELIGLVAINSLAAVFGLGSVSLFCTMLSPKSSTAARNAFGLAFFYLILSFFAPKLLWELFGDNNQISMAINRRNQFAIINQIICSGNPIMIFRLALDQLGMGSPLLTYFQWVTERFVLFNLIIGFVFGGMATRYLRFATPVSIAMRKPIREGNESSSTPVKTSTDHRTKMSGKIASRLRDLPPITDEPVRWWENYRHFSRIQIKLQQLMNSAFSLAAIFLICLLILLLLRLDINLSSTGTYNQVKYNFREERITNIVKFIIGIICFPYLATMPLRAVRCIVEEKTKDTFTSLVLTDLSPKEILAQKLYGIIESERALLRLIYLILIAAALTLFISPLTLILMVICLRIYSYSLTQIGISFSVSSKTANAAIRNMIFFCFGIGCVTSFVFTEIGVVICDLLSNSDQSSSFSAAVIPPYVIAIVLVFDTAINDTQNYADSNKLIILSSVILLGLAFISVFGMLAWRRALRGFKTTE